MVYIEQPSKLEELACHLFNPNAIPGFQPEFLGHQYDVTESKEGTIVISMRNLVFPESIVDAPFFQKAKKNFSEIELHIIREFEKRVQAQEKEIGTRKYSGMPAYWHIHNVVKELVEASYEKNLVTGKESTPLDLSIILLALGHDYIEEDREYRWMHKQWQEAAIKGDVEALKKIGPEIVSEKRKLASELKTELHKIADHYCKSIPDCSASEKRKIKAEMTLAARLISDLTRNATLDPYPVSMAHVYSRKHRETPSHLFKRQAVKNADRIANRREFEPYLFHLLQLGYAFLNKGETLKHEPYTVAERMQERFSPVNLHAQEMSRVVMEQTAINSVWPLHMSARSINEYSDKVRAGKTYMEGTDAYLGLALTTRSRMVESSIDLLQQAISIYESDPHITPEFIDRIEKDLAKKKKGDYFDEITEDGVLRETIIRDISGSKYIRDTTKKAVQENYRIAREIETLLPNFMTSNWDNEFDPHTDRLWSLGNFHRLSDLVGTSSIQLWEIYRENVLAHTKSS